MMMRIKTHHYNIIQYKTIYKNMVYVFIKINNLLFIINKNAESYNNTCFDVHKNIYQFILTKFQRR
jgi:hypothetical protein